MQYYFLLITRFIINSLPIHRKQFKTHLITITRQPYTVKCFPEVGECNACANPFDVNANARSCTLN